MKMFGKNEDRVIDNLLRASMRGRGGPNPACREFDPDLANAYIERSLSAGERASYELHLSECHACRSGVVALSRMVEAEAAPAVASLLVREPSRLAMLKGLFTPSAMPRVAAAALAVVVLTVSIPLLFSRKDQKPPDENVLTGAAVEQKADRVEEQPASQVSRQPNPLSGLVSSTDQPAKAGEAKAQTVSSEQEQPSSPPDEIAVAKRQPAEPEGIQSGAVAGRAEPPQTEKLEARSAAETSDQARRIESDTQNMAMDQATPPPPPPAPATDAPLARINLEDARRLRQQDKDAVSVTIKPGNVGGVPGVEKEEKSMIRPSDAVAPPSSAGSGERRGLAEPSPRARRDEANTGGVAFAPRGSPTRKVGSKKFWLSKDTWTDKDYNPSKELPVVTIERDSDIYKELLTKRSGLKLYLIAFSESERAIIIYKGTVYRLVPQNSR